jgi:hypothetical protein
MSENTTSETKSVKNVEHTHTLQSMIRTRHKVENIIMISLLAAALSVFIYWIIH